MTVEYPGFYSQQDCVFPYFQCLEWLQRHSNNAACPVFDLPFEVGNSHSSPWSDHFAKVSGHLIRFYPWNLCCRVTYMHVCIYICPWRVRGNTWGEARGTVAVISRLYYSSICRQACVCITLSKKIKKYKNVLRQEFYHHYKIAGILTSYKTI